MREAVLLCIVLASFYGSWLFMGKTDRFFDSLRFGDREEGEKTGPKEPGL